LPFLPLFDDVVDAYSSQTPHSSRFAAGGNLTSDVMGGKSSTIAARSRQWMAWWVAKTATL
jgi:hypothetical protein